MNCPYIDFSNCIYFREWTDIKVYGEGVEKNPNDINLCVCLCCDYPILKSSINQHKKTNKHKAFLNLIK